MKVDSPAVPPKSHHFPNMHCFESRSGRISGPICSVAVVCYCRRGERLRIARLAPRVVAEHASNRSADSGTISRSARISGRDFNHFFEDITKRPDFIYLGKKETRSSPKHLLKKTQSSLSTFPGRSQLKTFGFFLKSEGFLLTVVGIEHTSVLFVQRAVRMCIYICICVRPSNNAFFI